jgi:hypothetical protein
LMAQENRKNQDLIEKIAPISQQLADWHRLLSAQKSLSLVTVELGHVEPGFGHDDDPGFTATTKVFYKGDRFLYDVDFVGGKGTINSRVENFDGARYACLSRLGEGTLEVSSKPFLYDIIMCKRHFFFNPFLFLQSGFQKDALAQLSYERLTERADWTHPFATLSPDSTAEETTWDNEPALKVTRLGKHPDPVADQPCFYDIYFTKKLRWYPMKWERRLATDSADLVTSYAVEELGFLKTESGDEIPYPKISVVKNYKDGKLRDTERCEVTQIGFDTANDIDLAIDPNSAKYFRDQDVGGLLKKLR